MGFWADHAAIIGLVLLVIVFTALNPVFLTLGNIQSILVASSILMILTVGQAFVILSDGIDLSVASTMTLGVIAFGLVFSQGGGLLLSMLAAIVAAGLIGFLNGILVAKGKITDFIVTLGSLSVASGLALVLSDGKPISVFSVDLINFSTHGLLIFGFPFIVAAVVAILAHVVLFRTRFGTHLFATGGSKEAAQATGISTARIKIAVYTISGSLAGIAAIMLIARVGAAEPAANTTFLLNSVAAVVLGGISLTGGKGNIFGPIVGALLLTVLTNGLTLMNVSQFYQPLAVGVVVILAALLSRFQK
ncbi:ABC transporter permease [Arthrobacter sp. RIT-PI-e]|nr:ABC transporter permease [Arthrobacter sp. RIT-PI-e]